MKNKIYRCLSTLLIAGTILGTAYSANAMTLFYAATGRRNVAQVYVEAQFTNVEGNGTYGTIVGKKVNGVTIRLKEGDYNQSKTTRTAGQLIELSKFNNPTKTASGSWTWIY